MIKPGICSIALSELNIADVIETARRAGLSAIEWWGKGHVPHGDVQIAAKVKELTEAAGLEISSYGSYYQAGISENTDLKFQSVLSSAIALGAPAIRVWAGDRSWVDADDAYTTNAAADTKRIANMAAEAGISISFEFHAGTLTSTNESAMKFSRLVEHPAVYFSWQPPIGASVDYCMAGLKQLLPRLSTIHVFNYMLDSEEKDILCPLHAGAVKWKKYFDIVKMSKQEHFVLLEFVKEDSPEQVIKDSQTLKQLF